MDQHLAFQLLVFDETTFCFWTSKSPPPFFSFFPLAITFLNIKKTIILLLIVKFDEVAFFVAKEL